MISLVDWITKTTLALSGGAVNYKATPGYDGLIFVNDKEKIMRMKIYEYDIWYGGDSDELLQFYTNGINIEFNYEPFFDRNKRNYFWAIAATEDDIKRTHSGIVRTIIDTLTGVCGEPSIKATSVDDTLQDILDDTGFFELYSQEQLPETLVEGWGGWKINWDLDISDHPILSYYKAGTVYFIEEYHRVTGMIFLDYYQDEKNKYVIAEVRHTEHGDLVIRKFAFQVFAEDDVLKPVELKDLEFLKDVKEEIVITNYRGLLAVPCVLFKDSDTDTANKVYGRSILSGKIDLCDDYDQCFSQRANTVRHSTAIEYFDTEFLERDRYTNLPIPPHAYDRKYSMYKGKKDVDGITDGTGPVTVTQPKLDFVQYDGEATAILTEIINGIMSPASLGVDLARKDNADAQREKEKVTVFTRNKILKKETKIIKKLMNELLCANELMHTGNITMKDYGIEVEYSEFADDSFENKLGALAQPLTLGAISPDMYLKKLYGNSLTDAERDKELKYLTEKMNEPKENPDEEFGDGGPENEDEAGANEETGTDGMFEGNDAGGPEEGNIGVSQPK